MADAQAPINLSYSYSSLKQYENCPLRFYYQRISKQVKDEPGAASIHGERVHKSIEERLGPQKTQLPPELSRHEKLCAQIEAAAQGCEIFLEKELVLTKNLKPTTWFAQDAYLRTKADMLALRGRKALVTDWKTGARRPDFLQLELTALQVFIHYPDVDIVTGAFVWLREEKHDKEIYLRDDFDKLLSGLQKRIERVEHSVFTEIWPAKPSGLCRYCPANTICEFAR